MIRALLFLAAALALAGCTSAVEPAPITGIEWVLADLGGAPAAPGTGAFGRPYLKFDAGEGRVAGSTGVNLLSGAYKREGVSLKFGMMVTTRRAGPPALMAQETAFLKALAATASAEAAEGALVLRDASGRALARFGAAK